MALVPLLIIALSTAAPPAAPPEHENLLRGPARCVLRYLDAVRLAGPRAPELRDGHAPPVREKDYDAAKRLLAPSALADIAARAARGEDHPLAAWRQAAHGGVLESFQLLAVRRAPLGSAVITVRESYWTADAEGALARSVSEYLVARVQGEWRVVDRRTDAAFEDQEVASGYAGWFDEPGLAGARPAPTARGIPSPAAARSRRPAVPR